MCAPRMSERKRTQTQFLEVSGRTDTDQLSERRARDAAVASAYVPLGGLVQLGEVGGGEGRAWEAPAARALSP
jgi:hypothetical protein